MGTFNAQTPKQLVLTSWEQTQRAAAIAKTGSPSPSIYYPIANVPSVYTHVSHAAQYGLGRRNGRTIRMIVLHITDVNSSAAGAASYDARREDLVSATCFAGPEGELVYEVEEKNRAFTTGRWIDESLAVEIIGHDEWTSAMWRARPKQMEGITRLLVDWCRRYVIPVSWLNPQAVAEGASRLGQPPVQGVNRGITDHLDANLAARLLGASAASTSHVCVGPGLRAVIFEDIFPEVRRRLGTIPTPTPTPIPPYVIPWKDDDMPRLAQCNDGDPLVMILDGIEAGSAVSIDVINDMIADGRLPPKKPDGTLPIQPIPRRDLKAYHWKGGAPDYSASPPGTRTFSSDFGSVNGRPNATSW